MRLDQMIDELKDLEPAEKLEWVIDFSEMLPAVSEEHRPVLLQEKCRVQECQTAVYLTISTKNGRIHLEADVPKQSPTVRGLVAMVVCNLEGAEISEGLNLPDDLLSHLGLANVLGMTRQRGIRAVIDRIKKGLRDLAK